MFQDKFKGPFQSIVWRKYHQ